MTEQKAPREFSDTSRTKMAGAGVAMPDGSYPIPDKDALRRAIASYGRAKDPEAVKRHIIKRAKALGATSMLPENWGGAPAKGSMAAGHASTAADILEDLYCLIACEADETQQANMLRQAADLVTQFMVAEAKEIGQPGDSDEMDPMKAVKVWQDELKAEPMDEGQLDRWLSGRIPRRVLVVPFGGPLPGGKAGLDLDGEYFDEETDLFGPFPTLRKTRERLVDWHHDNDPTGIMKGAILGRVLLDAKAETDGMWADFWANAGEQRRGLIAKLERANVPLFGSSLAVRGGVRKADDGHIDVWPLIRHTITTSPQNTYAVVPALKALLMTDIPRDALTKAARKAALVGSGKSSAAAGPGSSLPGEGLGRLSKRDRKLAEQIGRALRPLLTDEREH